MLNELYLNSRNVVVTPVVSFIGASSSGKTTLLEQVVTELKLRGYRVAVIKHSPHGFDLDQPTKDTWRLAEAGSDVVAVSSPNKVAFIERVATEPTLAEIIARLGDKVDIVLTEGYKSENSAKVVVVRHEQREQLRYQGETLATVSAYLSPLGMPRFAYEDVARIVDLLCEQVSQNSLQCCPSQSRRPAIAITP